MKTLIQNYSDGKLSLIDIPEPTPDENEIIVKTSFSAVSIGTESSIIKLAKKSLLGKAIDRPDLVKRVFQKINQSGLKETIQEVMNRLDNPIPLGYSSSGKVHSIGSNVKNYKIGDTVAMIGADFANHSEFSVLQENMISKCPEERLEEASFGMLGCICLNAIRQLNKPIGGSKIAVLGAGILGNITSQILLSYGANVTIFDPNSSKESVFKNSLKANFFSERESFVHSKNLVNQGHGYDAVIIACGVKDNGPLIDSVEVVMENGEIVILGVVDIKIDRNLLWSKQASLIVSKAGGYGSLNESYEKSALDMPIENVRWTLKRNLDEFINLVSNESINIGELITKRVDFKCSVELYEELSKGFHQNDLGIILKYHEDSSFKDVERNINPSQPSRKPTSDKLIDVIGAGLHGSGSILPILKKEKKHLLRNICTKTGLSAERNRAKFGFKSCTTNRNHIFNSKQDSMIFSFEPHYLHFDSIKSAIELNKDIFIEKPLCVNRQELNLLNEIVEKNRSNLPLVFVGHNRQYSSSISALKNKLNCSPLVFSMNINAGQVPEDHWIYDVKNGGDRCIAECSHFVDLAETIVGSSIIDVTGVSIKNDNIKFCKDNFIASFQHQNGSISNLNYSSLGNRNNEREIFTVYQEGNIYELLDFKTLKVNKKSVKIKYDLGFEGELREFFLLSERQDYDTYAHMKKNLSVFDTTLKISEKII